MNPHHPIGRARRSRCHGLVGGLALGCALALLALTVPQAAGASQAGDEASRRTNMAEAAAGVDLSRAAAAQAAVARLDRELEGELAGRQPTPTAAAASVPRGDDVLAEAKRFYEGLQTEPIALEAQPRSRKEAGGNALGMRDEGDRFSAAAGAVQTSPLLDVALSYQGVPYRWGGASRDGLDCSGLVVRAAIDLGQRLPHSAADLFRFGDPVNPGELLPGDLVFFANTYKPGISHVGISEGGSRFLAASSAAGRVTIGDLNRRYYREKYAGARRLPFGATIAQAARRLLSSAGAALTAPFRLGPA